MDPSVTAAALLHSAGATQVKGIKNMGSYYSGGYAVLMEVLKKHGEDEKEWENLTPNHKFFQKIIVLYLGCYLFFYAFYMWQEASQMCLSQLILILSEQGRARQGKAQIVEILTVVLCYLKLWWPGFMWVNPWLPLVLFIQFTHKYKITQNIYFPLCNPQKQ